MNKLLAFVDLFRKGEAVANPQAWKTGQITATSLAGVVLAAMHVAAAYGHPLPAAVDEGVVTALCAATIGVVNIVLTYATSDKVGILPAKQ